MLEGKIERVIGIILLTSIFFTGLTNTALAQAYEHSTAIASKIEVVPGVSELKNSHHEHQMKTMTIDRSDNILKYRLGKENTDKAPLSGEESSSFDKRLRIATFNVQLFSYLMCQLDQLGLVLGSLSQLQGGLAGDCQVEERANQVADKIISNENNGIHYDVIAINEAWDEDGKDIIVGKLENIFPHYISYIDAIDSDPEDSGLMLFSKLPFKELPYHPLEYVDGVSWGHKYTADTLGSADVNDETVAYEEYSKCENDDCYAAKGAALVQVVKHDKIYTIVFTHTQADYPDEGQFNQGVRDSQLAETRSLIAETLTGKPNSEVSNMELQRHDIFVLGDLNIPYTPYDKKPQDACKDTSFEWKKHFGQPALHFGNFIRDAWFYTSSCNDSGFTSNFGTESRLDYILYNDYKNAFPLVGDHLCVQHIKLDFTGISDHQGIVAELNTPAPHCSPSEAWEDPHLTITQLLNGNSQYVSDVPDYWLKKDSDNNPLEIKHTGSVQWIKINEKGTYSFATTRSESADNTWVDNALDIEVYASTDLTNPLSQYKDAVKTSTVCEKDNYDGIAAPRFNCRDVEARTWAIAEAPFFVKIFDRAADWTGQYKLLVDKHMCSSIEDICILLPGEKPHDPQLIDDKPLNAEDKAWFRIDMEKAFSGKPQKVLFYVHDNTGDGTELLKEGLVVQLLNETLDVIAEDITDEVVTYKNNFGQQFAEPYTAYYIDTKDLQDANVNDPNKWLVGPNKFYMTVKRPAPISGSYFTDFSGGWQTNLSFFHGVHGGLQGTDGFGNKITELHLTVADETNGEGGSDDVRLCFEGPDNIMGPDDLGFIPLWCPFDDIEFDEGHGEQFNHLLGPIAFVEELEVMFCDVDGGLGGGDDCTHRSISPLDMGKWRRWGQNLHISFEDGEWIMRYNLSHSLMTN